MSKSDDKGWNAFVQVRLEEFDELWEEFNMSNKIEDSYEFKQVIFSLPIEALRDWKRNKDKNK